MTEDATARQRDAAYLGLTKLAERYGAQFDHARAAAERMVRSVPRDLPLSQEPAHTFHASAEA